MQKLKYCSIVSFFQSLSRPLNDPYILVALTRFVFDLLALSPQFLVIFLYSSNNITEYAIYYAFSYKICKYMQCIIPEKGQICKICSYKYRLTAFRASKTDIYEVSYRYGNPAAICIFEYFQALVMTVPLLNAVVNQFREGKGCEMHGLT